MRSWRPAAPYAASPTETYDAVDEVPGQLRIRTLAVRAFDADAMMVAWGLVAGEPPRAAAEQRALRVTFPRTSRERVV
jgi:Protein of unknown function (DUF1203)